MSENLSIDEIIKKAQEIKSQAEQQMNEAKQSLDKQAKSAMNDISVDESKVIEKINNIVKEDEDINVYVPT
jgi:hypothetical protein